MLNFFFNSGGSLSICFLVASGRRKVKVSSNLSMSVKFIIILSNTDVAPLRSSCCGWFAVEFRPEVHQADVQPGGDGAVRLQGIGHSTDRLADSDGTEIQIHGEATNTVALFVKDFFSVDYVFVLVYTLHLTTSFPACKRRHLLFVSVNILLREYCQEKFIK